MYQAANWIYAGQQKPQLVYRRETWAQSKWITQRVFNKYGDARRDGSWQCQYRTPKHKYIWIEGTPLERRRLYRDLKLDPLPYPKRMNAEKESDSLAVHVK